MKMLMRLRSSQLLVMGLVLFSLMSCEKEEYDFPATLEGEIVFFFDGTVDGQPLLLEAGRENVYMKTRHEYVLDSLWAFSGGFADYDCPTCPPHLEISIRDKALSYGTTGFDPYSSLAPGMYELLETPSAEDSLTFRFRAFSNEPTMGNRTWFFENEPGVEEDEPVYTFSQPGGHVFRVQLESPGFCNRMQQVYFHTHRKKSDCSPQIFTYSQQSYREVRFSLLGTYPADETEVRVDFGDGTVSTFSPPGLGYFFHTYPDGEEEYLLCYEITRLDGCTYEDCFFVDLRPNDGCKPEVSAELVFPSYAFSNVAIRYRSSSGVVYGNHFQVDQPAGSYFEILESTPFINDLEGKPTFKIRARFAARLYNESDPEDYIWVESADCTFAVSVPE